MISVAHLAKTYPVGGGRSKEALSDVSFSLPDKGLYAVLGPSGSGKTTLLRLLGLLEEPSAGSICFGNEDASTWNPSKKDAFRFADIGIIFQDYNLIPHLTVEENVALPFSLRKAKDKEEAKSLVNDLLQRFGLIEIRSSLPKCLSGGEAQRVAVARAVALNQPIILADEPTASLDEENAKAVMECLKEASKDALVLLVTHNEELAQEYAKGHLVLKKGSLVSSTLPNETQSGESNFNEKSVPTRKTSLFSLASKRVGRNLRHYLALFGISAITFVSVALCASFLVGGQRFTQGLEEDCLYDAPIEIAPLHMDKRFVLKMESLPDYPADGWIRKSEFQPVSLHANRITEDYLHYLDLGPAAGKYSLTEGNGFSLLGLDEGGQVVTHTVESPFWNQALSAFSSSAEAFKEFNTDAASFDHQYEAIEGRFPLNENEGLLIVSRKDSMEEGLFRALGISGNQTTYASLLGKRYRFVSNEELYLEFSTGTSVEGKFLKTEEALKAEGKHAEEIAALSLEAQTLYQEGKAEEAHQKVDMMTSYFEATKASHEMKYYSPRVNSAELRNLYDSKPENAVTIVGIFHPRKDRSIQTMDNGIYYLPSMARKILNQNKASSIALESRFHLAYDPITIADLPKVYSLFQSASPAGGGSADQLYAMASYFQSRRRIGAEEFGKTIHIRPQNIAQSKEISQYLDAYNIGKSEMDCIYHSNPALDAVEMTDTYFQVFLALILACVIVVALTDGLITMLVTALEVERRGRELSILRSLGASQGHASAMFVLEQLFVALCAGILSVGLVYAALPLVNLAISKAVPQVYLPSFATLPFPIALLTFGVTLAVVALFAFFPSYLKTGKKMGKNLRRDG